VLLGFTLPRDGYTEALFPTVLGDNLLSYRTCAGRLRTRKRVERRATETAVLSIWLCVGAQQLGDWIAPLIIRIIETDGLARTTAAGRLPTRPESARNRLSPQAELPRDPHRRNVLLAGRIGIGQRQLTNQTSLITYLSTNLG